MTVSLMIHPKSVHRVGPCAVNVSAPEGASSSRRSSGAAVFTSDGDLADLPRFARVAVNRFKKSPSCTSARACVAEREGMPSGALPLPLGPP